VRSHAEPRFGSRRQRHISSWIGTIGPRQCGIGRIDDAGDAERIVVGIGLQARAVALSTCVTLPSGLKVRLAVAIPAQILLRHAER
jgi:hypothetical protein